MTESPPPGAPIHPILLSGGSGSRLWPLSREHYPKQLLPLIGDHTMIQGTALRVAEGARFAPPIVICSDEHRFLIAEQLREVAVHPDAIVLEPVGRGTAAAAAVAALMVARSSPDGYLLLLPADHGIADSDGFLAAVDAAIPAAAGGALVTFGAVPTGPETAYGYIRRGAVLAGTSGVFAVDSFLEKPRRDIAERLATDGRHLWNCGIFLCAAAALLDELERLAPEVVAACRTAVDKGRGDLDFYRLDGAAFAACPAVSLDHAVMERTRKAAVVPADFGWSDVGAWPALWAIADRDAAGNAAIGDVLLRDVRNTYARSDGPLTAVIGVDDVMVVATEDAVLVCAKDHAQQVKDVVEHLKADNRVEARAHSRVYRPWGFYQSLHAGERFQVNRITVKPGARLALQRHFHRSEHWVVVNGSALVTRDDEEVLVRENESIYLPIGAAHRVANPGKVPLNLIEVQSGGYLGEDDIIRLADDYAGADLD